MRVTLTELRATSLPGHLEPLMHYDKPWRSSNTDNWLGKICVLVNAQEMAYCPGVTQTSQPLGVLLSSTDDVETLRFLEADCHCLLLDTMIRDFSSNVLLHRRTCH